MPRGGHRIGAGRKHGSKTQRTADVALKAAESGTTPIEYMLAVMRDESNPQSVRLQAAGMAAPFVHPRLTSILPARPKSDVLEKLYEQMSAALGRPPGQLIEGTARLIAPAIADAVACEDGHTS